jgi:3-hydroxybutyryl-CoA dehydrogenase
MGCGIAQTISSKGIEVLIAEKDEESLKHSFGILEQNLDREIQRWGMTESDKGAIMSRIRGTADKTELGDYDLVIEAVPEDMSIKSALFHQLDVILGPNTILVTNTSVLSVTELASFTSRAQQVIGMHFLHPVPKRPMVEIVRGLKTTDDTFEFVRKFAYDIGKNPIEVYESPGYVTTRVMLPMLNEAMYALMEGVASEEGIDDAMRLGFHFEYGPLQLSDHMGLDEVLNWLESMFKETGDQKYRPCPLLRKLVRAGHLGAKTGKGFFVYDENGRRLHPTEDMIRPI